MTDFKLSLDGKEYECKSTQSSGNEKNNWIVTATHGLVKSTISIPIEANITRAKVILFIEAFHVAMGKAFEEQQIDQNYFFNQKVAIK